MNKLTPIQLAQRVDPDYQAAPHIKLLQRFVAETLSSPGQAKCIIEMCVRSGKSKFCSLWLPTWYILNNPTKNVILTGYSAAFAQQWGRKCRDIVGKYGHLWGVKLSSKIKRAEEWETTVGGGMKTAGTNGQITGAGASLIISDDQLKDQAQANSPTQREKIFNWFQTDLLGRRSPDCKTVVVLSRRHSDDLTGRLLDTETGWRSLRLPALCDDPDNDPLKRKLDEPLCPSFGWTKELLLETKLNYELTGQSHTWQTQWMQNPLGDPASREFPDDYFRDIWKEMPTTGIRLRVLACDPSKGKHSNKGDYSAWVYMVMTTDNHVYLQSWLHRLPVDQIQQMTTKLISELNPDGFIYEGQFLQYLMPTNKTWEFISNEDKNVRIRVALTQLLGQKRFHLDPGSLGNRMLLNQLREFPNSAFDDGIDAAAMCVDLINRLLTGKKTPQQHTVYGM